MSQSSRHNRALDEWVEEVLTTEAPSAAFLATVLFLSVSIPDRVLAIIWVELYEVFWVSMPKLFFDLIVTVS